MSARTRTQEHLIVALDLETIDDALALVDRMGDRVSKYKIGSRLFTRCGPRILDELAARGRQVFLDLKYHDIPSVVGAACAEAARHEAVFLLTVHASGGAAMVSAAVEGARSMDSTGPKVVAVTALTSLEPSQLPTLGVDRPLKEWAMRLTELALGAGAAGVVCSAHEAAELRGRFAHALLVTPGIRLGGPDGPEDQARVMEPGEALRAGSDLLVVGRPIYEAADPIAALERIEEEIER